MECNLKEYDPVGMVPEYGAIFMANTETKKECLKMEVFALPSGSANFVKQVKAGTYLFLFEYDSRQLFGVYQARTDGGINIHPQGSSSSLKRFPAQVYFTPVWLCNPLHEKEFKDAIRENYFSKNKFNFGLSKDQVHKLLQLFSLRKLKSELRPKQLRDYGEPSRDLRHKINKKYDAENLEGRNGSPDLLIKDQGHIADRCKEDDNAYQYMVHVTDNRHNTKSFEQYRLPDNFGGSPSNKKRKEEDDMYLANIKDHPSVDHYVPRLKFGGECYGDTLDCKKRTKEDDDKYFLNLKDQQLVHLDIPCLDFSGEYHGYTFDTHKRRTEDDTYLMNLKDQRSVYYGDRRLNIYGEHNDGTLNVNKRRKEEDDRSFTNLNGKHSGHYGVSGLNFCGEYQGGTMDSCKRRKEDDDRYLMGLKDQRSVHHNVPTLNLPSEYCVHTQHKNKREQEDDMYVKNLKDQRSIYHNVPAPNFGSEYCGDTLNKLRQSPHSDELLVSGKVQYEDDDSILAVGKYLPVPSDLRAAGNNMYTFADRAVADSEHGGRPSSNSPRICSETFEYGANGLSDDKFPMNLGSKRTYKLLNSDQDVSLSEINGVTKCSKPDFHYLLNKSKCSTQNIQNMDLQRPDNCKNSANAIEGKYRPCTSSQFESEHYLGVSLESGYSFGKLCENTVGYQGVTGDSLYTVRDGRLKGGHSVEPFWSNESHGNSSRSDIPSRRSLGDRVGKHNQVEGEPCMDSFHNPVRSFGYGASCQPNEDMLIFSEGSPPRNQNHVSEAQHLFHTYPSYHESVVTKSVPCDSDHNFSHLDPSSSLRVGIAPCHGSGEPHVSKSISLLYHPEENHSSKFPYIDLKYVDKLECSPISANQDFYCSDTSTCFLNTEAAQKRELENGIPTNCRSPLFGASPSAKRRLPENVQNHASSPHKNLSANYFDSEHPSSSRFCEHIHINQSMAEYPGGNNLTNYDSGRCANHGQVMSRGNGNSEHPSNLSPDPRSNKRSVFARLSSGPEISSPPNLNDDTTVEEEMDMLLQDKKSRPKKLIKVQKLAKHFEETLNTNQKLKASVDEVMGMLTRQSVERVSKTRKNLSLETPVEHTHLMSSSEQDQSQVSSSKLPNDVNQAVGEGTDGTLRETRLVDFRRRSEKKKIFNGSTINGSDEAVGKRTAAVEGSMGNKAVDNKTAGDDIMLSTSKRRKLIRPVFVEIKSAAEGMEDKPKMHVLAQSLVKDARDLSI